ncbi:MarR family winged helix-turn-helix transcriptional regulator [Microbacterium sp. gxy059]|uniref:Wt8.32c n=1 Tax=uncultured bacterium WT8 TaxID=1393214 RepID=U3Q2M2_9BACT|nr:Wt8.32c [uncultured bacterium WT8]
MSDSSPTPPATCSHEPTDDERIEAIRSVEAGLSSVFAQFRRLVKEQADRIAPGMHPATYKMFWAIAREAPVTASRLGDVLEMDKAQVSRGIRYLEENGLVERTPDPSDGRVLAISVTEEGARRLADVRPSPRHTLYRRVSGWSLEDLRTLGVLLDELTRRDDDEADD